jgi:hypothetical protein
MNSDEVLIAILAKDKAYCLPLYLECLYKQNYNKKKLHLYVRANDSKDDTEQIVRDWVANHRDEYASVYEDYSHVDETLMKYQEHEWNPHRFRILGAIRQASIDHAKEHNLHYFTADCDNFLTPECLTRLMAVKHLGMISPLLDTPIRASNLHHCADPNGYYKECAEYNCIRYKTVRGLIEVEVAHMTYLIPNWVLPFVKYIDGSNRYEYVVISDWLRKSGIKQYMDSTIDYGFLYGLFQGDDFKKEIYQHWITKYPMMFL